MTDPSLDPILAYLRDHSGRYSLEALRGQLLQAGYDPAAVDQAVAVYRQQAPVAPRQRVWPKALLVLAANAVLVGAAIGIGASGAGESVTTALGFTLFLIGCAEFLGGFVLAFPEKTRPWGLALLFGFFLTVGLGVLVLGGVCVYFLSQGNNAFMKGPDVRLLRKHPAQLATLRGIVCRATDPPRRPPAALRLGLLPPLPS